MTKGAWTLGEFPLPMVRVSCAKCGRAVPKDYPARPLRRRPVHGRLPRSGRAIGRPLLALDHGSGAVIVSWQHPDTGIRHHPAKVPADQLGPMLVIDGLMAAGLPAIPDDN